MARGIFSRTASRKSKFEEALSAVEQGLAFKFDQLLREWPSDLPSAKRALSAILVHLSKDRVPSIEVGPHGTMDKESARLTLLCNAALAAVNGVLDRMVYMREDHVQELFGVLRMHYSDLMAWLIFLAQDILIAPPEGPNPRVGSRAVANTLKRLLDKDKIKYLEDDMEAMEEFVELVLAVWVCSIPADGEGPNIDGESYPRFVHPLFDMLWNCLMFEPAKGIAFQKVASYSRRMQASLANSFSSRCLQWADIHLLDDDPLDNCKVFIGTALLSQALTNEVPSFSRILAKSSFPSAVLEAAMNFPFESTQPGIVALPIQIGQLLLAFQPSDAYELRKVIPELFEAGLLKAIVHQLLSPRATVEKPFPDWHGRNPLLKIASMCFVPEISYALSWALDGLSEETLEELWTGPVARKHWRPFLRATGAYQKAYEQRLEEDSDGEVYDEDCIESVTLCDNVDHAKVDGSPMILIDAVECSWCHVVVYCSEECQRYDWKKFHRKECAGDRIYRIDRQLQGAWISHRTRMLMFRVYEFFLQKAISVIASLPRSNDQSQGPSPAGKVALVMDHSTLPLSMRLFDMEMFKSMTHDGGLIFADARSTALIKEYEEDTSDTIRLTGGIAPFGQYVVIALGSFLVEPEVASDSSDSEDSGGSKGDGRNEEEKLPQLTLKNGYIRILEVVDPDEACQVEVRRELTGITRLSFEPPDESDAYDSDSDFRRIG